jgi:Lrp/AsnC family transcriptional regulator, regulator for asnA, asnC and gidA
MVNWLDRMTAAAIDELDVKILRFLLKDARSSLKTIAKECNISSVSVLNRINRLKKIGVITGSAPFASLSIYNFQTVAFLGIETERNSSNVEVLEFLKKYTFLIEPSVSIGRFDLHALIYFKDQTDLNNRVAMVRRLNGVGKVSVFIWTGVPTANWDNVDLIPQRG